MAREARAQFRGVGKSMSSIDVVVPCYRYAHYLRQCVESVLSQPGPRLRVLIIDDASPDNTSEVARELATKDARVAVARHAANRGHIATYNEGLDWASGTYLLLLSADDYLLPGALSRSVTLMDAHPEVGFVFGNVLQLQENGATREVRPFPKSRTGAHAHILMGPEYVEMSGATNLVATPTAVVRTEIQKQLGGYRPELPHAGDMEMWLRFAARASVGFVDAAQAVYRLHASNMSNAYMAGKSLPDVRQRKAALDLFFDNGGRSLPRAMELRRRVLHALAREALGLASAAFNDEDFSVSKQLCDFARFVSPGIDRSWPWMKVAVKRRIGIRASRMLRAALRGHPTPDESRASNDTWCRH
jgi:glycosyltransferase involved in cell wall biosynthesis